MNATDYLVVSRVKRLELLILPCGGSFQRISFETTQNRTRGLYHDFPFRTFNKSDFFQFSNSVYGFYLYACVFMNAKMFLFPKNYE